MFAKRHLMLVALVGSLGLAEPAIGASATVEAPERRTHLDSLKYRLDGEPRILSLWRDAGQPEGGSPPKGLPSPEELVRGTHRLLVIDSAEGMQEGNVVWFGVTNVAEPPYSLGTQERLAGNLIRALEERTYVVLMIGEILAVRYEVFEVSLPSVRTEGELTSEDAIPWPQAAYRPLTAFRQGGVSEVCVRDHLEARAELGGVLMQSWKRGGDESCPPLWSFLDLETLDWFDPQRSALEESQLPGDLIPLDVGGGPLALWRDNRPDPRLKGYRTAPRRLRRARELGILLPRNVRLLVTRGVIGPPGEGSVVWLGATSSNDSLGGEDRLAGRVLQPMEGQPALVVLARVSGSQAVFEVFRLDSMGVESNDEPLALGPSLPWGQAVTEPWATQRVELPDMCGRDRLHVSAQSETLSLLLGHHSGERTCPTISVQVDLRSGEWASAAEARADRLDG